MDSDFRFLVIKVEDLESYLNPQEQAQLASIFSKIESGRTKEGKQVNEYLVVNHDELYAEEVESLIEEYNT